MDQKQQEQGASIAVLKSEMQPLKVSLIGHSFIRRLRDYIYLNPEDVNVRLDQSRFTVSYVARGGLTVPRLFELSEFTHFPERPHFVFLPLGGNDISCSAPNIQRTASDILNYAQYLVEGVDVQHVIIGQVLRRTKSTNIAYNDDVMELNNLLTTLCSDHPKISFWRHRGFWASLDYLDTDGVHIRSDLEGKYSRKYLQSIKSAILHFTKFLDSKSPHML
ncbi:hypothetical protein FSP39_002645 [Pinctada imbricata]|uniref:SGNH hydrolase-type esterase domain-containing protein n=1 Tax=Pinctada imbricata TaxID=66713 RepID=A0AA89C5E3_PINIB|nr:hypothetical protein FSP39_002645 [Pinctada imbricata]